jgi:hypothetical protein
MFGVTGTSDVVGTLVLTLTGDLEPVERDRFARVVFDSGDKDGLSRIPPRTTVHRLTFFHDCGLLDQPTMHRVKCVFELN